MDNAQKAIMIGVGLFITIIIIAAVMLITGMGQDLLSGGQEQVSNISTSLQKQLTDSYDNTTITGAQVISAIKRYCTDQNMVLVVKNKKGAEQNYGKIKADSLNVINDSYSCASTTNNTPTAVGKLTDTSSADTYVASTASYTAKLIKISENVVGLHFEAK